MGKFDICCKSFYSRNSNFADLINGAVFKGKYVVSPGDLEELGTEILDKKRGKSYYVDVTKKWKHKGCNLLITAIENQKNVDYGMVVRNMVKESLMYENQLDEIKDYHANAKDIQKVEYVSGICKSDMLTPVIIVVLYFGDNPWDGPKTLYDMVDLDEALKPFIFNYRLNLIDYHDYDNFNDYTGEVKKIFDALKTKDSEEEARAFFQKNPIMYSQTAEMLGSILGIRKLKKYSKRAEEGDVINMCKAWDDHYNSGVKVGMEKGIEKGIEKGREEGILKGREEGMLKGREEGILKGLNALVDILRSILPSFEAVYEAVVSNETYKNLSREEVMKYY